VTAFPFLFPFLFNIVVQNINSNYKIKISFFCLIQFSFFSAFVLLFLNFIFKYPVEIFLYAFQDSSNIYVYIFHYLIMNMNLVSLKFLEFVFVFNASFPKLQIYYT